MDINLNTMSLKELKDLQGQVGRAIAQLGLPTVLTFEGGYAVAEVGINTVNVLHGMQT